MATVNVQSPSGDLKRTVELPDAVFDTQVNVPLIHQVVVAQLAAARQGTHDTKTRGEVRGGGRKPYRQKGTGRARQGSIRAPQFAGGGIVHGPTPRSYAQRTPKKMKAAALRGALSDRARAGRLHIVSALLDGDTPSTKSAAAALATIADSRHLLVVLERTDVVTWKSLRNVPAIHVIAPDQLNTYDVLVSDDIIFTEGALATFLTGHTAIGDAVDTLAQERTPATRAESTPAESTPTESTPTEETAVSETPATESGSTKPAGEGLSDEQAAAEVAEQTSPDLKAEDVFEREAEGGATETPAADIEADDVGGEQP